jgi:DNA-binding winged helix-turn-helix (wHTH) protein/uncharacterized DUF497 family protein
VQAQPPQPRALRFGIFEMDLECSELRKNGSKLKLSGHPFHMLAMIAVEDGRVVTYEELQTKLWPQTTIGDYKHSLGNSMLTVRKTLGDSAREPRYIQTVPNGYRFLVPVTVIEKASERQNGSKKHHQAEFLLELQEIRRELLTAPSIRGLQLLVLRCEALEKQYPQYPTTFDLQALTLDVRMALQRSTVLDPLWPNFHISSEAAALVFNDPNAISIPLINGGWKTLGRVSESVLLVVEHTEHQENEVQAVRIKGARRATPPERRFYEQSSK